MNVRVTRTIVLGSLLLGSLLFCGTVRAQQGCGLSRTEDFGVLIPVDPDVSHPALTQDLALAYRQWRVLHKLDAAAATASRALATATEAHDQCAQALATYVLAANAKDAAQAALQQSAEELFAAAGSRSGVARVRLRRASALARQGKLQEADELYQQASAEFTALGDSYEALSARVLAIPAQKTPPFADLDQQAKALHEPCLQAEIQEAWAGAAHTGGLMDQATSHLLQADQLYLQCRGGEDSRAGVQTALGRLEREQGRPMAALDHYRIALRIQMASGDLSYVPQTYNAMAVAYENNDDFPHAIPLFLKGLSIARQIHSQPFIDFLEANLGSAYAHSGHARLAVPLLERTTQNLPSEYLRCVRVGQLGEAYSQVGEYDKAIQVMNVALTACRTLKQMDRVVIVLQDLSQAEFRGHHDEDALLHARESITLIEQARAHVIAQDAYKQGFHNQQLDSYNTAIAALTALHRPAEALEVAEQARARAFLDLLASRTADDKPADPHSLAQFRKDLIASPASTAPLSVDAMLAAATRLHSTLLAYWLADDTLYVWVARPGEPVFETTQPIKRARLSALVATTRRPGNPQAWRTLYRLLIAPVETHLPTEKDALLTIIPSGPLFALSFPALVAADGRYLVERFRTHTIPSVGLLPFTQHNAEAASALPPRVLFVDNPSRLPAALAPLPGTAVEVDAILKAVPALASTRLEGSNANAAQLKAHLAGSTTVHLATHAVLNDGDPYASFLALDDAGHDGRLSVAEIYALHLTSRLVVLSACSSGLGKVTGDGVDGMSRAFFFAGSAAVLSTLWDIADSPTAALLPRFYRAMSRGDAPSAALRAAQLSMLNDLRHHRIKVQGLAGPVVLPADPIYWAAFSLAGEP